MQLSSADRRRVAITEMNAHLFSRFGHATYQTLWRGILGLAMVFVANVILPAPAAQPSNPWFSLDEGKLTSPGANMTVLQFNGTLDMGGQ